MKNDILSKCELLMSNKAAVKSVFGWDDGLVHLMCASIFTSKGLQADEDTIRNCKDMLKDRVGLFSNFRGNAKAPIISMLAANENPNQLLTNTLTVYDMLKKEFFSSSYLPFAAIIIAENAHSIEYESIIQRTKEIYKAMKADHPFLTNSEDSAFCALFALSEKSNDELLSDAEQCYRILKGSFLSSNSVQSLSHVLALCDGDPQMKCEKTLELYQHLKTAGCKYGTSYELPTLGVLALSNDNLDEVVEDIVEIDSWLKGQKGFGIFSNISKKQRLMYAGILAQKNLDSNSAANASAINGSISLIIAQQAAMCAAMAACSASAASSSSAN